MVIIIMIYLENEFEECSYCTHTSKIVLIRQWIHSAIQFLQSLVPKQIKLFLPKKQEKILWIIIKRYSYTARTSLGRMFFSYQKSYITNPPEEIQEFFGYTLEDTTRPGNIKVYAETCLPGGLECDVSLFENDHYGKTIIFHTEDDKITILFGKLKWTGCLAHGGTTHLDTAGCVLVARNKINNDTIQGSLKDELRKIVEQKILEGFKIKARFINLDQLS